VTNKEYIINFELKPRNKIMENLNCYAYLYKSELLEQIIPFWEKNSIDKEYGGYFTCLDREGSVYDTDKFMWLQGRQVWMFSTLYNQVEKKQQWLDIALSGAGFMKRFGMDEQGNWYFSLTRDGKPLIQPYNIFSDCFAAMAFAELFKATGIQEYSDIAIKTYHTLSNGRKTQKGNGTKHTRAAEN